MKNTLVLFIILFNIFNSFSQTPKQMLDKMFEIANNKSDQEGAKNIALDLINSKYGAIDNETNFYAQYVISDFYYSKRKFKLASHYFNKLLQFSEDKNIKVEGIRQFLKDIKLKIQDSKFFLLEDNSTEEAVVAEIKKNTNHGKPSDHEKNQIVTINTNSKIDSNLANHTPSTSVYTRITNDDKTETLTVIETEKTLEEAKTTDSNSTNQTTFTSEKTPKNNDEKTVTLTVSGTGKTLEEAKTNALRSAIEQAFGAFISSKTEVLNDNLVLDQITSVANGNIQSFEILNESLLPNGTYATSLKVVVSIEKLTNFVEAKGVKVEIKGGLFALNIKQQLLNEQGETKAICDLVGVLHEVMQTSFNYSIKSDLPKSLDSESKNWEIPIVVTATCNKNIDFCANYFINTIKNIGLSEEEVKSYNSLNKKVYKIDIFYKDSQFVFYFRQQSSFNILKTYHSLWAYYTRLFTVKSGLDLVQGLEITKSRMLKGSIYNLMNNSMFQLEPPVYDNWPDPIGSYYRKELGKNSLSFYFLNEDNIAAIYKWSDNKTLNQIENLDGYVVNPKGVHSYIKNGGIIVNEKNGHGLMIALYDLEPLNFIDANLKSKDFLLYGYKNWRLPSIDECNEIYNNLSQFKIGGFRNEWYLTNNKVYDYGFDWGNEDNAYNQALWVRFVRSF